MNTLYQKLISITKTQNDDKVPNKGTLIWNLFHSDIKFSYSDFKKLLKYIDELEKK